MGSCDSCLGNNKETKKPPKPPNMENIPSDPSSTVASVPSTVSYPSNPSFPNSAISPNTMGITWTSGPSYFEGNSNSPNGQIVYQFMIPVQQNIPHYPQYAVPTHIAPVTPHTETQQFQMQSKSGMTPQSVMTPKSDRRAQLSRYTSMDMYDSIKAANGMVSPDPSATDSEDHDHAAMLNPDSASSKDDGSHRSHDSDHSDHSDDSDDSGDSDDSEDTDAEMHSLSVARASLGRHAVARSVDLTAMSRRRSVPRGRNLFRAQSSHQWRPSEVIEEESEMQAQLRKLTMHHQRSQSKSTIASMSPKMSPK